MQPALPADLQIVCGDWDISFVSENLTPEVEVVLTVLGYTNHPDWSVEAGPLGGADIAVYQVDPAPLEEEGVLQPGRVWPACLPSRAHSSGTGVFAGICNS